MAAEDVPPPGWQSQLCSCGEAFSDFGTTASGIFLPSVLFGTNVNRITDGVVSFKRASLTHLAMGGCCCWCCCLPSYAAPFREQLRKKKNLPMDPYTDLHTHMFCHPCAIMQEARELDSVEPPTVLAPSKPNIDRHPDEVKKHLEENMPENIKTQAEPMTRDE